MVFVARVMVSPLNVISESLALCIVFSVTPATSSVTETAEPSTVEVGTDVTAPFAVAVNLNPLTVGLVAL